MDWLELNWMEQQVVVVVVVAFVARFQENYSRVKSSWKLSRDLRFYGPFPASLKSWLFIVPKLSVYCHNIELN